MWYQDGYFGKQKTYKKIIVDEYGVENLDESEAKTKNEVFNKSLKQTLSSDCTTKRKRKNYK